jgi:hypothetical protein
LAPFVAAGIALSACSVGGEVANHEAVVEQFDSSDEGYSDQREVRVDISRYSLEDAPLDEALKQTYVNSLMGLTVTLDSNQFVHCTASYIGNNTFMTAAHCTRTYTNSEGILSKTMSEDGVDHVTGISIDLPDGAVSYKDEMAFAAYDGTSNSPALTQGLDVALVTVDDSVEIHATVLQLSEKPMEYGQVVYLASEQEEGKTLEVIQGVVVRPEENQDGYFGALFLVPAGQKHSACPHGTSGTSAINNLGEQVGILSGASDYVLNDSTVNQLLLDTAYAGREVSYCTFAVARRVEELLANN